ncbi:MAG: SBBP repeat-containing protein, partial [Magnetococcus sp. DMHC-6]
MFFKHKSNLSNVPEKTTSPIFQSSYPTHLLALEPRFLFDAAGAIHLAHATDSETTTDLDLFSNPQQNQENFFETLGAIDATAIPTDPLRFEPNLGQTDPAALFVAQGTNYGLFLTETELLLTFLSSSDNTIPPEVLSISWEGSNNTPLLTGENLLTSVSNHYTGDPSQWVSNIANYGSVVYHDLYPNIDLILYGVNGKTLEYDFVVNSGADPNLIQMNFSGSDFLTLDESGNLCIHIGEQELINNTPVVYQIAADGRRELVDSKFVLTDADSVTFQLGTYDTSRPLFIDPVISYGSYLGGSSNDWGFDVTVDSSGNIYVTGGTLSNNFPTLNAYDNSVSAADVFVTKYNSSFTMLYSTYLGGTGADYGYGITNDSSGNAYITGETSSNPFPTTAGAFQTSYGGGTTADAFLTKLNATGGLSYSTYLGGNDRDVGRELVVHTDGYIYITGTTISANYPTSGVNAIQSTITGVATEAFVTILQTAGSGASDKIYSTYLGGSANDFGWGIAVDSSGYIYIVGETLSSDFDLSTPTYDNSYSGGDGFLSKINYTSGASGLIYSTFIGGTAAEKAYAVDVDDAGNAYIAGITSSNDFPTTAGAPQTSYGGGVGDAFSVKLNTTGTGLIYGTYLGGTLEDNAFGIVLDVTGDVWISGRTKSNNFPVTTATATSTAATQGTFGGTGDIFITWLNSTGTNLKFSTYLGSAGDEFGTYTATNGIALDNQGGVYAVGTTSTSGLTTTGGGSTYTAGTDAILFKYTIPYTPTVTSPTITEDTQSEAIPITINPSVDAINTAYYQMTSITGGTLYSDASYSVVINNGTYISSSGSTTNVYFIPTLNSNSAGSFTIQAAVTASSDGLRGSTATSTISITPQNDAPTVANPIPDQNATEDTAFSYQFAANVFNDVDTLDTLTYSALLGDGVTGLPAWLVFTSATRTFSGTPTNNDVGTITIQVTATDNGTGTLSVFDSFTLTVINTNDAPTDIALSSTTINENIDTSGGTTIGTLTRTDVDATDTAVYTIVGGVDAASFSISGTSLVLTAGTLNFESKNSYAVTIRITDSGSSTYDKAFTITVNDLNEAPVITSGATATFAENATGTLYTATATDVDAADTKGWSLSGDDAALFAIDGSGLVTFVAAPNFESP